MATVESTLEKLEDLKHQRRTWQHLRNYIYRYVETEMEDHEMLPMDDGGYVDQKAIEKVLKEVEGNIVKLDGEASKVKGMEVKNDGRKRASPRGKANSSEKVKATKAAKRGTKKKAQPVRAR